MAKLRAPLDGIGQDDFVSSATQIHDFGVRVETDDGRVYRYCKAGVADLVAGNVIQGPAIQTVYLATAALATAIGATALTFTPGAATATANSYAGGWLGVSDSIGAGYTYAISGHPAIASSTTFTLTLKDPIQVALTTASKLGLLANPYNGVIQMPVTTATGCLVGVAPYIITAAQYGWLQTWGPATVLVKGTPALGAAMMSPGTVAGGCDVCTTTNLVVAGFVGNMCQIGVDAKQNFVDLKIRP